MKYTITPVSRNEKKWGTVCLVGAGPGAGELLTIRGMERLKACDAVVYDHLASQELLGFVRKDCRIIYAGKEAGSHSMPQEEINRLLIGLAKEGLNVVRLKGGDPFVFGRGSEEILALKEAGISWETVPGITSAVAVPELAGIPVTHRGISRSFHVITGHTLAGGREQNELKAYAAMEGTLVFLMGFHSLSAITEGLIRGGKSPQTPAALIENGSLLNQRVLRADLETLAAKAKEQGFHTPAIIVVGEAAAFNLQPETVNPRGPLDGMTVGLIGTEHFTDQMEIALRKEGAKTETLLRMECLEEKGKNAMASVYPRLGTYTWLVLTSVNGVRLFFKGLFESGLDIRALGHMKVAAIGAATCRALLERGIRPDLVPEEYCSASLAQALFKVLHSKDRVLMARVEGASVKLAQMLIKAGIPFDDIPLYAVKGVPSKRMEEQLSLCRVLIFASPSGVRAFKQAGGFCRPEDSERPLYAAIGPVTAEAMKEEIGKTADIIAESYHIPGLVKAVIDGTAPLP